MTLYLVYDRATAGERSLSLCASLSLIYSIYIYTYIYTAFPHVTLHTMHASISARARAFAFGRAEKAFCWSERESFLRLDEAERCGAPGREEERDLAVGAKYRVSLR